MYTVIHATSNGDTFVMQMSKEELESRLNQHYYGTSVQILSAIPDSDVSAWPENSILIIKGEIAAPKAREIVTLFSVE